MDENKNVLTNKALAPPLDGEKPIDFTQEKNDARDVEKGNNVVFLAFGWGRFRPKCLQFLNCPIWFFVVISVYTLCQGVIIIGLSNLVLPTIERRYSLTSKELGVIAAANDITALLLVVFLSYYGDYANKINLMGIGAVFVGIGAFVFALPHFMTGRYEPDDLRTKGQCITTNVSINNAEHVNCEGDSGGKWYHMATFVFAQLILGGGIAPMHSLLPAYLDENVEPKSLPIYLGFFYFFFLVSPGVGFFIGGQLLSIYVDIKQPDGYQLTLKDPRWIGAWWIGFLIFGALTLLSSVILFGFPRELPGAKERRENHIRQGHLKDADGMEMPKLRDLLPGLKSLLTNWTYLFNTLAITISLLYSSAVNVFLAKIFRLKFGLDPQRTGYMVAVISTAGITVGNICGSVIVRMFSLKEACRKAAFMCFFTSLVTICTSLVFLIPGCMNSNLAGVSTAYHTEGVVNGQISTTPQLFNFPLKSHCNINCGCSLKSFSPVCGSDSRTYFDACHAGCTVRLPNLTFTNCSCIPGTHTNALNGTAQPGYCDRKCKNVIIFVGLMAIFLIIRMIGLIPGRIVTLRSVPDNRRAFALGIQYVCLKTLGLLPGPIILGHLVDLSCRLWQDICGKKGRCFDYNITELSQTIAIFGIVASIINTLFYFLSWYLYKSELNKTDIDAQVIKNPGAEDEKSSEVTQL